MKKQVGARIDENLYKALKLQAILEDRAICALLGRIIRQYLQENAGEWAKTYLVKEQK